MANGTYNDRYLSTTGRPGPVPRDTAQPLSGMPVVAMYHSVSPYDEDPYLVTVTPERFDRQMHWLRRRGLRGVSVSELMAACRAGDGRGLIGLTFDDGYADFIDYALPVLARYGFSGTVFPIAGRLGGQNDWDALGPRKPLMSVAQVRKATDGGIEIGSHGLQHVSLRGMAEAGLAAEAEESRAILAETTGQEIAGFCYPYGHIDESAVAAVQAAGYAYGCAIWRSASTGAHALPRVYVGDADGPLRLWAKSARHWLTWDYRGPGATRVARLAAGEQARPDTSGPSGIQQLA